MARVVVGSLHLLIGLLLAWGAAMWVAQIGVNATWEMGFYGEISVLTSAAALALCLIAALCVVEVASAIGWMFGRPIAGGALAAVSVLLAVVLPGPLRLLMAMSAASIGLELWARARALDPVEESEGQ